GAVEDDRTVAVWLGLLDPRLERAAWDVHGTRNVAFVPLVPAAHVDEERRLGAFQELPRGLGVDLVDLRLDASEELPVVRHRYRKYSVAIVANHEPADPRRAPRRRARGRRRGR